MQKLRFAPLIYGNLPINHPISLLLVIISYSNNKLPIILRQPTFGRMVPCVAPWPRGVQMSLLVTGGLRRSSRLASDETTAGFGFGRVETTIQISEPGICFGYWMLPWRGHQHGYFFGHFRYWETER